MPKKLARSPTKGKAAAQQQMTNVEICLLDMNDDLLLHIIDQVTCINEKRQLRLSCRRLCGLASLTIHQLVINDVIHKELTGPNRRNALCLQLAARLPAIHTAIVETLPSRGLLPRLLLQLPSLTDFEAGDKPITPAAAAALSACPALRSLTVVISPATLPSLPPLPSLLLLNMFLSFKPSHPPRDLTPLTRYPTLTSLSLHHLPDPHPDPHFLAPLALLPNLQALHFCAHCPTSTPTPGFILTHLTNLTVLSIPASGTHTLSSIPSLTSLLELSLCGPPSAPDLETWAKLRPSLPALRTLSCYFAMIAPPVCIRAPSLAHLHIHELPHPDSADLLDVSSSLKQMLPLPSLSTLHLHTSPLPQDQTCQVLHLLAHHVPHLQDLNLDGTFCLSAVQSLRKLTALQHLTLHAWVPYQHEMGVMASLHALQTQLPQMHSFTLRFY